MEIKNETMVRMMMDRGGADIFVGSKETGFESDFKVKAIVQGWNEKKKKGLKDTVL
jgi:hypothetical protein